MKSKLWMVLVAVLSTGLGSQALQAQEPEPKPDTPPSPKLAGVVKGTHVNVRAKPSLNSEVIVQLNPGDKVTVLEKITLKSPIKSGVNEWLCIALPKGSRSWIHASFIDVPSKTVTASSLNVRGGPGENYSILGRLPRGTVVQDLETQGNWIRIEPPANSDAKGYVAAFLVDLDATAPVEPSVDTTPPEVVQTTPPEAVETTPPPPIVEPPAMVDTAPPEPTIEEPVESIEAIPVEPAIPESTATNGLEVVVTEPAPAEPDGTSPPPIEIPGFNGLDPEADPYLPLPEMVEGEDIEIEVEETPPPPKRIISREGIVRRSLSIQAPSPWTLEALRNRRIINYLHSPLTNHVVLLDHLGKRVLVTGEELLEERWLNTPVLKIDTLEPVP